MIFSVFGKSSPGGILIFAFLRRKLKVFNEIPYSLATSCRVLALRVRVSSAGLSFAGLRFVRKAKRSK